MPSKKRVQRLCRAISDETRRATFWNDPKKDPKTLVAKLNRMLIGRVNYFCLGPVRNAYSVVDRHARTRLRRWLSCFGVGIGLIHFGSDRATNFDNSRILPLVPCCNEGAGQVLEGQESSMSERKNAVLAALQALAIRHSWLETEIWHSIAVEALAGIAPAQYIVATAFEELDNIRQAREWFELSAAQGYAPALAKLASDSAALSHEVPFQSSFSAQ
jgi:hypothetical protein